MLQNQEELKKEEKFHSEKIHNKILNTNKKEFVGGLFSVGIIVLILKILHLL